MNPRRKKWGSSYLLGTCIFLTTLWVFWVPALWSQQAGFPGFQYQFGYPPPGVGPAPAPYLGAPTYNPNAPAYLQYPGQSAFFQGMMVPPGASQPSGSFYGPQQGSPNSVRSCQYSSPMMPPLPPQAAQPPSTGIPEASPWPGSDTLLLRQVTGSGPINQSVLGTAAGGLIKQLNEGNVQEESQISNNNNTNSTTSFVYEPFSTIESSFNLTLFPGQPAIGVRQFGYSIFSKSVSTFAPVLDVPVGPDYILGPGDSLQINVWGSTQLAFLQSVDRNGEINLPNVGPVRVWGLTFDDAGKVIRRQLTRYFRGIKTNITMGRLRTIRVYVVGEVCQPGSYTLSSLSTLTNALFAAGGPVKLGTLRNISLKRNRHTVGTTDLYDFLLRGDKTRDFRLQSGDTIFVPPVGSIAAITGEVKRPAIYELKGTTRVSDLIELAGGTTPRSYLKRIQVIRNNPNVGREIIDLDLTASQMNGGPSDIALQNGDLVSIYPTDPRIYNTVRLLGAVKHPGEYEFKADMRLSQLIQRSGVLPEAHIDRIEIARLNADLKTEILEVSLKGAWAGDESQDIALKSLDQITVRSEYRKAWTVKLEGEFKRPGTFTIKPGERLSAVLRRAGGFTEKAYPKGVIFTRRSVADTEAKVLKDFVKDQEKSLLAETTQLTTTISTLSRVDAEIKQAVLGQRIQLLHLVAAKVTLGRIVIKINDPDKLEGSPNDLVLQDGDTIKVPQIPSTVMVVGSVRNPTSVLHQEDKDVQYYLNRAGGLTPEAASNEMYLLKGDGSAIAGFMSLRSIEPGDVIIVPPSTEAKVEYWSLMKDIASILGEVGKVAIGVAGLGVIF